MTEGPTFILLYVVHNISAFLAASQWIYSFLNTVIVSV